jgi:hypothetical protein
MIHEPLLNSLLTVKGRPRKGGGGRKMVEEEEGWASEISRT